MLFARHDVEATSTDVGQEDSLAVKRGKPEAAAAVARPTLTRTEVLTAAAVLVLSVAMIFCIFLATPRREFGQILRLPRSLADVRLLK